MIHPSRRAVIAGALALALAPVISPALAQDARTGTFEGADASHPAAGSATVEGGQIVFGDDFSMGEAPDPRVAFGSADAYAEGTDFAAVESLQGGQSFAIPEGVDPSQHEAVWLWCGAAGIPLGKALLN